MSTLSQFTGGKPQVQEFNSTGTFTVPSGVSTVFVTISAGGAGGPIGINTGSGSGAYYKDYPVSVTPGASITVTIGAGGSGSSGPAWSPPAAGDGNASSFGPALSVTGGGAAVTSPFLPAALVNRGYKSGPLVSAGTLVQSDGEGGLNGKGAFNPSGPVVNSMGGGGGYFGDGGDAGFSPGPSATSAAANSGGGGGTGYAPSNITVTAGNGGSGKCIVVYYA